jgi:hypothetical protein
MGICAPTADPFGDRRRPRPRGESATEFLQDLPALVVLRRLAIPMLAVDDSGAIVFANDAFAAMIGHTGEALVSMRLGSLLGSAALTDVGVVSALRARANSVMRLRQADGGVVPVLVGQPALLREDDTLALVAFTDQTDLLWHSLGGATGTGHPGASRLSHDVHTKHPAGQKVRAD